MDRKGGLAADLQVSTVGLVDPADEEGQAFEEEILIEIEEILDDMTDAELKDDAFVAEEIRIGLRRFVQHKLQLKPKTSVHLVRV